MPDRGEMSVLIEFEAEEDGGGEGISSRNTDLDFPAVDFARPAKQQRRGAAGEPITGPHGKKTGAKRPRSEGFRVSGTSVFLTYAGLDPNEFTLAEVHALLREKCKGGCAEIITCREIHPNPKDPAKNVHYHAYVKSRHRFDTTSWEFFKLTGPRSGEAHFGHVQIAGSTKGDRARMVAYVMKDGEFMANLDGHIDYALISTKSQSIWTDLVEATEVPIAMARLKAEMPKDWLMHGEKIEARLWSAQPPFTPALHSAFKDLDLSAWEPARQALVLAGVSGAGKTQFALHHFKGKALLVRELEDLKKLTAEHSGIVFDDIDCSRLPAVVAIHLLDLENASSIPCRHKNAWIPAGMPRVFTTNKSMKYPYCHIFPAGENQDQHAAILRRFVTIMVTEPLFECAGSSSA